jgi:hypothetical protein
MKIGGMCYTSNLAGRCTSRHRVAVPSCLVASSSWRVALMGHPGAKSSGRHVELPSRWAAALLVEEGMQPGA